ncbi:hypothetical protein AVEN_52214-1, partial [Araneus ventricosus]
YGTSSSKQMCDCQFLRCKCQQKAYFVPKSTTLLQPCETDTCSQPLSEIEHTSFESLDQTWKWPTE